MSEKPTYQELFERLSAQEKEIASLTKERDFLRKLIDNPEIEDFAKGVMLEAAHQVNRWGTDHDLQKPPEDWFWTLGYLAGKALSALKSGDMEKFKHHLISSAALLANFHSHACSNKTMDSEWALPGKNKT